MFEEKEPEPFQCEAFPKPGKKKKSAKIMNKKIRIHDIEKPKETHCRFCGLPDDGSCYFHHCEIPYLKIKYGSGTSRKINDNLTVWAHHTCGSEMSIHPIMDSSKVVSFFSHHKKVDSRYILEWELKWLYGIIETWLV